MKFPTLYKRSLKGAAPQQWTVRAVKCPDGTAEIVTEYGKKLGKMQTAVVKVSVGKNVGRSNATTPIQQAEAEAGSMWRKRVDKGYVESTDRAVMAEAVAKKPMLAATYVKGETKVDYPCKIQPKLDGVRCLAHKGQGVVLLYSRAGKPIATVPHVNEALAGLMDDGEVWDGELYTHLADFQDIVSWAKRAQPDSSRLVYHVYDRVSEGTFGERFAAIQAKLEGYAGPVAAVLTQTANGTDEVSTRHDEYVRRGYEGAILRVGDCPYRENARSSKLLKVKIFDDGEFPITAVIDGKGRFEGLAIFRLKTAEGVEFDAVPKGTDAIRRDYFERRGELVGQLATVRYFGLTTSNPPVPRFPVAVAVRDYEGEQTQC